MLPEITQHSQTDRQERRSATIAAGIGSDTLENTAVTFRTLEQVGVCVCMYVHKPRAYGHSRCINHTICIVSKTAQSSYLSILIPISPKRRLSVPCVDQAIGNIVSKGCETLKFEPAAERPPAAATRPEPSGALRLRNVLREILDFIARSYVGCCMGFYLVVLIIKQDGLNVTVGFKEGNALFKPHGIKDTLYAAASDNFLKR